ncbi:hypothetical protein [Clostridium sp.]|uniref:hypothetical protein n=1 Tax=Clostridium sp. TaxID=1506 RepID=UPI0026277185|nr:hypothetical protein [Clostridium sp.]
MRSLFRKKLFNDENPEKFWSELIRKNETLKGRMFKDEPITENTKYLHYVIFNRHVGIQNVWVMVPNFNHLVQFIQYVFMPEAYYKWVEGKKKLITHIPSNDVEQIISMININNTEEDKKKMKNDILALRKLNGLSSEQGMRKLRIFCSRFNNNWLGDSDEFLYLKVFNNAEELGKFIVETNLQTDCEKCYEKKIGMTTEEWFKICENAHKNKEYEEKFKNILFKYLEDIV